MYLVKDLYERHGQSLGLELMAGRAGVGRKIKVPEAHRPGLSLCGYLKNHAEKRILIFGKVEIEYLRHLDPNTRIARLEAILKTATPAVIIARHYRPPKEVRALCENYELPLFRTNLSTMNLLSKLSLLLTEEFSPSVNVHGTLVEVFGVGVLIQGDSAVGKSEAALGLIERGHRLVSDDIVKVKKKEGGHLEGSGADLTRHHMEIRGIGIINVANLYGAVCVRNQKSIDIAVRLEVWQDDHFYDRVGLEDKFTTILGVRLPYHTLPVKPGRDVVLLLETIALNHRLKEMGYNSAQEFSAKVLELTTSKKENPFKAYEITRIMTVKLVRKVRVKNRLGLHTRPATTIVKLLQNCKSDVSFTHKQETVNAKSILSLLMLAAQRNSNITITVEGEDANLTMDRLVDAFESHFGE